MGNVIMSGIVPPLEKPVGGTPLSKLAVGSTLSLNVNGVAKEFLVVHNGKPGSMYDDSCDGVWLLMKDLYEKRAWHSANSNSYKDSTIHSYLNNTFFGLFDTDVQSAIKQVKIPHVNGTGGSAVASGSNGLSAKVFLLSCYEVGLTTAIHSYIPVDGSKLGYFEYGNTSGGTNQAKRIAYYDGTATLWWLRSPHINGTNSIWRIGTDGGCGYTSTRLTTGAVRPCIILPSDALLSEDGTIIV